MENPQVSIIMAVKDTEPYLPDCLDSIINQTYTNWELIAVNDHSADRTPEILKAYSEQDSRIKVYDSPRPLLIPTLQEAYKFAKGPLLNRMDSDDKMPDYKLEIMVEKWLQYGKGHVIAGGTEHFVDEGEVGDGFRRYERWLNQVAKNSTHIQEIYTECVIPSHSWMIHKDDFDRVGAFDSEIYPEDYDLCFRFYKKGIKIIGLDKVLHYWRDRSNRISRTWECYEDNRYFDLKVSNFYDLDRDPDRPLVLWGAGKNGKDLAKLLLQNEDSFHWVCDNPRKIGKDIYGIRMQDFQEIPAIDNPQMLIVVTSPDAKTKIREQLKSWGKQPADDFWFFI